MKKYLRLLLTILFVVIVSPTFAGTEYGCEGYYTLKIGERITLRRTIGHLPTNWTRVNWVVAYSGKSVKIVSQDYDYCTIEAEAECSNVKVYCQMYYNGDLSSLYYDITVSSEGKLTVTASPEGGNVLPGEKVTLSTNYSGATIYYTLNGSTPTTSSTLYTSSGLTINESCTLKAIAVKSGYKNSDVLTATYTVPAKDKLTLTTDYPSGPINPGMKVHLTANVDGAGISYKQITTSSTREYGYSSSGITVNYDVTIIAVAKKTGYIDSEPLVLNYTIPSIRANINLQKDSRIGESSNVVPVLTFFNVIKQGENINNISIKNLQTQRTVPISHRIINEKQLAIVPGSPFSPGIYKLSIPHDAVESAEDGEVYPKNEYVFIVKEQYPEGVTVTNLCSDKSVLLSDGSLWTWGSNYSGQLGIGIESDEIYTPMKVLENVEYCNADGSTFAAIKKDGSLWMWGYNASGQCGDSKIKDRYAPYNTMQNIEQVVPGRTSFAIDKEGKLWSWGSNYFGALGQGFSSSNVEFKCTPQKVDFGSTDIKVKQVVFSDYYTAYVVTTDNKAYWWGQLPGRTMPGKKMDDVEKVFPDMVGDHYLKTDKSLWISRYKNSVFDDGSTTDFTTPRFIMNDVVDMAAFTYSVGNTYEYRCFAITTNSDLYAWGINSDGRLGTGDYKDVKVPVKILSNIRKVYTWRTSNFAIGNDNRLWYWGTSSIVPVVVAENVRSLFLSGYDDPTVLSGDGTVYTFTPLSNVQPTTIIDSNHELQSITFDCLPGISIGKQFVCVPSISPADANVAEETWSVDDTSLATISNRGVVTSKKGGTVKITYKVKSACGVEKTYEKTVKITTPKGDVNLDGNVNDVDASLMAGMILGVNEINSASDVNGDGKVNGTDYVNIINILTDASMDSSNARQAKAASTSKTNISIEPIEISPNEEKSLLIDLNNPSDEVSLVQFDMELPDGITLKKDNDDYAVDIAGRTTWRNHSLSVSIVNGAYRFTLSSNKNAAIQGSEGALISASVIADENFKKGGIKLTNILMVTTEQTEINQVTYSYLLKNPGAKLGIKNEANDVFVSMQNPNNDITLVQFDVRLPEGVTICEEQGELDFDIVGRTTWKNHSLDANPIGETTRFLLSSNKNNLISGTDGDAIRIGLVVPDNIKEGDIQLENILLVSPDLTEFEPENVVYCITESSGVESILDTDNNKLMIFSLSGIRMKKIQKGINIVNGKKTMSR